MVGANRHTTILLFLAVSGDRLARGRIRATRKRMNNSAIIGEVNKKTVAEDLMPADIEPVLIN